MILKPCPVRSDRFTWVGAESLFVTEASDLGPAFRLGRVYDDACDEGFTLVSAVTGKQAVFVLAGEKRDGEGDLLWHDFTLAPESARDMRLDGRSADVRVRIFND